MFKNNVYLKKRLIFPLFLLSVGCIIFCFCFFFFAYCILMLNFYFKFVDKRTNLFTVKYILI